MRPMQQPIRAPADTQNQPTGGVPGTVGPDLFNRPLTASAQGPIAAKPTMTPSGNVGASGPVQGATVPIPKPMLETPPMPTRAGAR
jgi:hypothetical protein